MDRHLILFDIDATLMLTRGLGAIAQKVASDKLFGEGFSWEVEMAGRLDPHIFRDAAMLNQIADWQKHHETYRDHYITELESQLAASELEHALPGVHDILAMLHRRATERGDVVLGLLTGNYTKAVPVKLRAAGIDPGIFTITAFGDEGDSRPDLTLVAMRKYEEQSGRAIDPHRVIVVGDTPHDIACAKTHDCTAFAVATGSFTVDDLLRAGADVAVEDLRDPSPLLELIGE